MEVADDPPLPFITEYTKERRGIRYSEVWGMVIIELVILDIGFPSLSRHINLQCSVPIHTF